MSLYGTRDASYNWQEEVAREMRGWGFKQGKYNPCLYYHEGRKLRTFLHGDDFATVGTLESVSWLKANLEKRFEIKSECVSPAAAGVGSRRVNGSPSAPCPKTTNGQALQEGTEARLLNRIVRCTAEGWEWEPDQRHADLIIQELQLSGANGVTSPGESDTRDKMEELSEALSASETTRFRALSARANYLAADRPDIMYAVKELCRGMAKPTMLHWHKLKRLGRYLLENSRTSMRYDWQGQEPEITGCSDSAWAGCRVGMVPAERARVARGSHAR